VLGGLLFYLGLELLLTWAILSWFRLSRLDYALVITILVVVATVNFLAGMAVGLLIACLLFVVNSSRIDVVKYTLTGREQTSSFSRSRREQELLEQRAGEILMLCLQSYIFFGTAHSLYETVRRLLGSSRDPVRFLILDFRLVSRLDSSAAFSFAKIHQLARQRFVALVCCGMTAPIEHVLREGGCLDGAEDPAVVSPDLDHAIEWCENRILRREGGEPVTHHPIAEQLHDLLAGAADVQTFIRYFEPLDVPAHHCLFRQGDEPTNLYFLESGQVTIWLELPGEHHPTRLRTMGAGSVIGEMGLFTGEPRSASVITDQPTRLHGLSLASLQAMRQRSPHLADAFQGFLIRTLSERLTHCERKLQALLL
jgi:SulP family sulfate permease